MALALTEFEALCGFRPLPDIAANLHATPELESVIPSAILQTFYDATSSSSVSEQKLALKNLFTAIMTASKEQVHSAIDSLVERYSSSPSTSKISDTNLPPLILKLQTQFPHDVGILCPFI